MTITSNLGPLAAAYPDFITAGKSSRNAASRNILRRLSSTRSRRADVAAIDEQLDTTDPGWGSLELAVRNEYVPAGGYLVTADTPRPAPERAWDDDAIDEDEARSIMAQALADEADDLLDAWYDAGQDLYDAAWGTDFDPAEIQWGFIVSDRPVGSHGGYTSRARDEAGRFCAA